jgi:large subunit ribosomal protein L32e
MEFIKRDARKLKRIGMSWRKPRGHKNKTKVGKRGHRKVPSEGFRSPVEKRYRIAGKIPVRVHTVSDLDKLTQDNNVIIAGSVGALKRAKIIETCKSKNIQVVNYERNAKNAETASK